MYTNKYINLSKLSEIKTTDVVKLERGRATSKGIESMTYLNQISSYLKWENKNKLNSLVAVHISKYNNSTYIIKKNILRNVILVHNASRITHNSIMRISDSLLLSTKKTLKLRITGPLWGTFTSEWLITHTKDQ